MVAEPQMAGIPGPQTLAGWIKIFVALNYPDGTDDRAAMLNELVQSVPLRLLPSYSDSVQQAIRKAAADVLRKLGMSLTDGQGGTKVDVTVQLDFPELRMYIISKVMLVKADLDACRAEVEQWTAVNNPALDIDGFMREIRQAVGL